MPTKSTKTKRVTPVVKIEVSDNKPTSDPETILFAKNDTRGIIAFVLAVFLGVFGYIQLWSLLGIVMTISSVILLPIAFFSLLPSDIQKEIVSFFKS